MPPCSKAEIYWKNAVPYEDKPASQLCDRMFENDLIYYERRHWRFVLFCSTIDTDEVKGFLTS